MKLKTNQTALRFYLLTSILLLLQKIIIKNEISFHWILLNKKDTKGSRKLNDKQLYRGKNPGKSQS